MFRASPLTVNTCGRHESINWAKRKLDMTTEQNTTTEYETIVPVDKTEF